MTGTERKVFQKYYPADFDPKKLQKEKGKKRNLQFVQRVMSPFNMQCNTCREYIYKGKKFNMRRETAEGENYLGLKIFRFYFRCPNCLADISFKTDIENVDYTAEHGATRLFEAFKHYQAEERKKAAEEEAEKNDAMKMLEKRTKMSRAEMDAISKLEELQDKNKRRKGTDVLEYLDDVTQQGLLSEADRLKLEEEADERLVQELMGNKKPRLADDEGDDVEVTLESCVPTTSAAAASSSATSTSSLYKSMVKKPTASMMSSKTSLVRLTKKTPTATAGTSSATASTSSSAATSSKPSALGGIADYGSSSGDSDQG